jgi:hypothetical protein
MDWGINKAPIHYPILTMASHVLTVSQFDPHSLRYSKLNVNTTVGNKTVYITSGQTMKNLELTTPRMMTWGLAENIDPKTQEPTGRYSMQIQFPKPDEQNDVTNLFKEKLQQLEDQILDDAVKNSKSWWGKEKTREFLKETLTPVLKYPKNKDDKTTIEYDRPPTITAKADKDKDGKWKPRFFDAKKNLVFPKADDEDTQITDVVPKYSKVVCNLRCGGIWISGNGWGITWRLSQCIVQQPDDRVDNNVCNIDIPDDDLEEEKEPVNEVKVTVAPTVAPVSKPEPVVPPAVVVSPVEPDTDDESETPVSVVAPAVVAPKTIVKKTVIKKKVPSA